MIPSLAIHMNRDVNKGVELNPQTDMLPLLMMKSEEEEMATCIKDMIAEALNKEYQKAFGAKDILSFDLFAENAQKAVLVGANDAFIMSARYDDLSCVFAGMKAMLETKSDQYINVFAGAGT